MEFSIVKGEKKKNLYTLAQKERKYHLVLGISNYNQALRYKLLRIRMTGRMHNERRRKENTFRYI